MSQETIGFIGLGNLGKAIADNIAKDQELASEYCEKYVVPFRRTSRYALMLFATPVVAGLVSFYPFSAKAKELRYSPTK